MTALLRKGLAAGTVLAAFAPALHAQAHGGWGGCHSCNVPPPCDCNVPTGHEVNVPGVTITPPSVVVNAPTISLSAPSIEVQTTTVATASSSAQSSAYSSAASNAASYALSNAVAASNVYAFGGGGGGFTTTEGGSSFIPNLVVEGVEAPTTARVCAEMRSVAKVVAVQAVCLDDKAIPHPASQVIPDRDITPSYEGEVFRCIAGTHMQYTLGEFAGAADFAHGQTISCLKGEALYHAASGELACRPQRPARDCNERSLLRRYGAGIKVVKASLARQCVAWRTVTAEAGGASPPETMVVDGGVGH